MVVSNGSMVHHIVEVELEGIIDPNGWIDWIPKEIIIPTVPF